jgi:hypothetical protein
MTDIMKEALEKIIKMTLTVPEGMPYSTLCDIREFATEVLEKGKLRRKREAK